jgi:hypothetical protein
MIRERPAPTEECGRYQIRKSSATVGVGLKSLVL